MHCSINKIKNEDIKLKSKTGAGIGKNSLIISVVVLICKVIGFIKQSVVAWAFGVGTMTDVFFSADGYTSMIGQVMSQSVAPTVVTKYIDSKENDNNDETNELISASFIFFGGLGFVLTILSLLFSTFICSKIGIAYNTEQLVLLHSFFVCLCPVMIITAISGVAGAVLDGNQIFLPNKMCSLFFSFSIIISIFIFRNTLGVWALLIGFMFGYILHMVFMLLCARKFICFRFVNPFKVSKFKSIMKNFLPMVVGNSVLDFGHLVDRIIASSLISGSVSILYYGQVVSTDLVQAVIITTVGTVLLSTLSKQIAQKEEISVIKENIRNILISMTMIINIIIVLFLVEGKDLIRLFFERGSFNSQSTDQVYFVAISYSLGFLFMAYREVLIKVHYAFQDTKSPMINSILGIMLNIVASLFLSKKIGVSGIAVATSLSMLLIAVLSCISVKKHIGKGLINLKIIVSAFKIIIIGCLTFLFGYYCLHFFDSLPLIVRLTIKSCLIIIFYFLIGLIFREYTITELYNKKNKNKKNTN